jgi:hypothetical protein
MHQGLRPCARRGYLTGVRKGALTFLAVLAAAAALPGRADAAVTATDIRISSHVAFVRVVIDFTGGRARHRDVFATDPRLFGDGRGRISIEKPAIDTDAAPEHAFGVDASFVQGANRIVLHLVADRHRFKYLGYDTARVGGSSSTCGEPDRRVRARSFRPLPRTAA